MAYVVVDRRVGKGGSISYRAQVRLKRQGKVVHQEVKTFAKKSLAYAWGERRIKVLETPGALDAERREGEIGQHTVGSVIKRYVQEFDISGRFGRSKRSTLAYLQTTPLADLSALTLRSADVFEHARKRRLGGAAPSTVQNDLTWLRVALKVARPAWGIPANVQAVEDALILLRAQGLVARPKSRRRRPTQEELERLSRHFQSRDARSEIPMFDIMWFAIHSGRRQEEITRLLWADQNETDMTGVVRDMKHPRQKEGNHRCFKYTREAWDIVSRQPRVSDRIFPYNAKSIGSAFTRACRILEIEDLRFHDLRHEATSRLFEKGYPIVEVQQFTLHESWDVLRRYTNLRPENVQYR